MNAPDLGDVNWRKSTRSGVNGNCVEVADNLAGVVGVRDSKDQQGPVLAFVPAQWIGFVEDIKAGRLDV